MTVRAFVVVVLTYLLAHGLTAWLIAPVQALYMPEITVYASLVYLPHGVRVLAAWLLGWTAVFPLAVGALLSEFLFTSHDFAHVADPVLLKSVAVGAASAPLAFGLLRMLRPAHVTDRRPTLHWSWLLLTGAVASGLNSVGQSLVFSGRLLPGQPLSVSVVYLVGDIIGLVVTALALMLVFRAMRSR